MTYALSRTVAFRAGMKDTIPMLIGAAPFGVIFGVLAVNSGLSPLATQAMSLSVFAGSSQFIAVGLLSQNIGVAFIILTTFMVNLRHALYAASLAPYMRDFGQRWLFPLGFWLTDETYATVIRAYADAPPEYMKWYHLGSSLFMYANWQLWTFLGIVAGTKLVGITELGLDFAMVVTFIGILIPMILSRPLWVCAFFAAVLSILTYDMPNKIGIIISSVLAMLIGVSLEYYLERNTDKKQTLELNPFEEDQLS
ncbi:AzlC family ABC transporter permease [Anaerolineales bacterium]